MRVVASICLFAGFFLLMACQPWPQSAGSSISVGLDSATELVHGKADPESARFGLMITTRIQGDLFRCSATIIAPRIILSAAHCFRPDLNLKESPAVVMKSDFSKEEPEVVPVARITQVIRHPKFEEKNVSNFFDLAVAVVDRDFPAQMSAVALAPRNWTLTGQQLYFVGAGSQHPDPTRDDMRPLVKQGDLSGEARVVRGSYMGWMTGLVGNPVLNPGDHLVSSLDNLRTPFICKGDSGGALVERQADGSSVQVGVLVSTFMRPFAGRSVCYGAQMAAVPVSAHAEWIHENVQILKASISGTTP
jgi:secreted trypsin-like serine protease